VIGFLYLYRYRLFLVESIAVVVANFAAGTIARPLWNSLAEYQRNRILVVLDPEVDPRGAGYQLIQSKVAVGSGGLTGQGFTLGPQKRFDFLPEQHTDFIFSVIGEELGFLGVGLALFFRNRNQFNHYVSVVSFVFYACYLIYIFLPVIGPRIIYSGIAAFDPPPEVLPVEGWTVPEAVLAGPFRNLMATIYHYFETEGAAFPSSHVAVALCTVFFTWRYLRRIRYLHLAVAVLLCFSTVYCRYHFVVDVLAGLGTAVVLIPTGNWLYFRFSQRAPERGGEQAERLATIESEKPG